MSVANVEDSSHASFAVEVAHSSVNHFDFEIRQVESIYFLVLKFLVLVGFEFFSEMRSHIFVPFSEVIFLQLRVFTITFFVILLDVISMANFIGPVRLDAVGTDITGKKRVEIV